MWTRTKKTADSRQYTVDIKGIKTVHYSPFTVLFLLFTIHCLLFTSIAFADDLRLDDLISEALRRNQDILVFEARAAAAKYRIPQAKSLPDPMFMIGYQNEGTRDLYTFGNEMMPDSQWMFSASQMLPFPGKLSLKGDMASKEAEGLESSYDSIRLKTISRVKELYYDLFLAYKNIELIKDRAVLFSNIEDAALARYSSGMGTQQEVIMAQIEKYMLIEREEMQRQRIESIGAMLNSVIGREATALLGRPAEPAHTEYIHDIQEMLKAAYENSPEIKTKKMMISAAETKVRMAEREYYPDFTLSASYFARSRTFPDMWSLTSTINVPLFYKTKQRQGVLEAEESLSEARHELEAVKLMLSSGIRENYSMYRTAESLMGLYRSGLIPKTYQDFESAIAGYATGKAEAITVINRLKFLIDLELSYWEQLVEKEKAIARLEAITGVGSQGEK